MTCLLFNCFVNNYKEIGPSVMNDSYTSFDWSKRVTGHHGFININPVIKLGEGRTSLPDVFNYEHVPLSYLGNIVMRNGTTTK